MALSTFDDARARVREAAAPLDATRLPLDRAVGCRLATPVRAAVDFPPADVSSMDGYAARTAEIDIGTPLPVAFAIAAGDLPAPLPRGYLARIFTGARLPDGADAVVPQENATADPKGFVRLEKAGAGAFVRRRGEIFRAGDDVLPTGTMLTPAAIGAAASAGAPEVEVLPRPRVAIVATGAEIAAGGQPPRAGQIHDANTPMLIALLGEARLPLVHAARATDDLDALVAALDDALARADLVVTTGGVSVGDHDLVPRALASLGAKTILHGVSMRPGKPILLARWQRSIVVGLPGNPISALVGWRTFVRPLAEALAGDDSAFDEAPNEVRLTGPIGNDGPRLLLAPARLAPGRRAEPLRLTGSHDVVGPSFADALVRIEPGARLGPGDPAGAYPLPWRCTIPA